MTTAVRIICPAGQQKAAKITDIYRTSNSGIDPEVWAASENSVTLQPGDEVTKYVHDSCRLEIVEVPKAQ